MSYIYIKQNQFLIENVSIKINNDNLILNYIIPEAEIKLKNIIFKLENHTLLTLKDACGDYGEYGGDSEYTNNLRIVLTKNTNDILNSIDHKISEYVKTFSKYEYIPIINREAKYNYIKIYINNFVNDREVNNINTYLLLKFKLINGRFLPRMYTYHMNIN